MYHLSTPYEVMRKCYEMTGDICIVDTICHQEPYSSYFVLANKDIKSPIEGDLTFELQPTYRGILETILSSGFKFIVEIIGTNSESIELYNDLSRRCFIAFKKMPSTERLTKLM